MSVTKKWLRNRRENWRTIEFVFAGTHEWYPHTRRHYLEVRYTPILCSANEKTNRAAILRSGKTIFVIVLEPFCGRSSSAVVVPSALMKLHSKFSRKENSAKWKSTNETHLGYSSARRMPLRQYSQIRSALISSTAGRNSAEKTDCRRKYEKKLAR